MKLTRLFKKQELQITLALAIIVVIAQLTGFINLSIPPLRNPFGPDPKSYQACNGLDSLVRTELKPLFTNAAVTKQTYRCRTFHGDPPTRQTFIYYSIRSHDYAGQTMESMHANLDTEAVAAGWREDKNDPGRYISPSNNKISVSITARDPASGTYEISAQAPGTFIPADASTDKPAGTPGSN